MRGRTVFTIAAASVFGLVILYVAVSAFLIPNTVSPVGVAKVHCEVIARCLKEYYAQANPDEKKARSSDVVKYLQNHCGATAYNVKTEAPTSPYDSAFDFSVYLLLPENLESASPVLAAYTGPIGTTSERSYRIAVFLRDNHFVPIAIRSHLVEEIVGQEGIGKRKPDFYYWHHGWFLEKSKQNNQKTKSRPMTKEMP